MDLKGCMQMQRVRQTRGPTSSGPPSRGFGERLTASPGKKSTVTQPKKINQNSDKENGIKTGQGNQNKRIKQKKTDWTTAT